MLKILAYSHLLEFQELAVGEWKEKISQLLWMAVTESMNLLLDFIVIFSLIEEALPEDSLIRIYKHS
jgi:hypothetical protein